MRIAIVGAGLAGLSLSHYLLSHPGISVTLFDKKRVGENASGVSTGLLHPFVGKSAIFSKEGKEAMEESLAFLETIQEEVEEKIYTTSGIFRPAITKEQEFFFKKAQKEGWSVWKEEGPFGKGLWIPKGTTVFSRPYLRALLLACQRKGLEWIEKKVDSLEELKEFDQVVLTVGHHIREWKESVGIPLKIRKGHALLCKMKEPLSYSLNSDGHISLDQDPYRCRIGSTYEKNFANEEIDPKVALELIPQVASFYPKALDFSLLAIEAGIRVAHPHEVFPIIRTIHPKLRIFVGLGSRGLLYHAYFAKKLSFAIVHQKEL